MDSEIPHRTTLHAHIMSVWNDRMDSLKSEMEVIYKYPNVFLLYVTHFFPTTRKQLEESRSQQMLGVIQI